MPHVLEQFTENLGNVVENEQSVPITERVPKEVIRINIFRGGEQTSQSGMHHRFDEEDLQQVVDSYNPQLHLAPLIRGHEEKDDGAPSSGWVQRIIRNGLDLFADVALTGFGQQMLQEGNYKRVSCRFYPPDDESNPTPGDLSLRHLALVTIPAVKGLHAFSEGGIVGTDWDFLFSEQIAFATPGEREEIKNKLIGSMQQFILDGDEDQEADSNQNEVQDMELSEDEPFFKIRIGIIDEEDIGVPFEPKMIGDTSKPGDYDFELDNAEFEEASYSDFVSDFEEGEEDDDDKEKTSEHHDTSGKRQKEYKDIIEENVEADAKAIQNSPPDEQRETLLGNLQKHFGNNRAQDYTPKHQFDTDDSISERNRKSKGEKKPTYDEVDDTGEFTLDGLLSDDMIKRQTDYAEKKESKSHKNVELLIPEPKKRSSRKKSNSYSEALKTERLAIERAKKRNAWRDYSEGYYSGGVLTEAMIPHEELIDALVFLDSQTQTMTFSEGQINPLDTVRKILDYMPMTVGLNGYDPYKKESHENLFKDQLPEVNTDSLVYSEGNSRGLAFDASSFGLHQQAAQYAETNGVDYYAAIQALIKN